jgi:hypothetical protein
MTNKLTIDMTNNRVAYGLLTDEEKAALHEHQEAGGGFLYTLAGDCWVDIGRKATWNKSGIYRTVPSPAKTQDVIAWDRLPDRIEWVTLLALACGLGLWGAGLCQ